MSESVRFGIIGAGSVWRFHHVGTKNNPKIKFVAVHDTNEKNLKKIAKKFNMEPYSNLDDFLKSDIDAVLIMVPHFLHERMVAAVAEAGKHILCEKPMAITLEGCDSMIEKTKEAGVKFMIAENHRFLPAHEYIARAVQEGLIGKPFLVRAYEGVNEIPGLMKPDSWKGDPLKAGGGALMDMGAHKFATINWILKDTVESANCWITKQCTNLSSKGEDNAIALLKYKSGVLAEITTSFTVVSPPTNSLEIYGTEGTIIENHEWINPVRIFSNHENMGEFRGKWHEPEIEHGPFPIYYRISMEREDAHFAECILENKTPEFTPEQAREAIKGVLLGYLSARENKEVKMDELMDIYQKKGTKSILIGLENYVKNNYCI